MTNVLDLSNPIKNNWSWYMQCYGPVRCYGYPICCSGKIFYDIKYLIKMLKSYIENDKTTSS